MTNIQSIRLKQFAAVFLVVVGAAAWVLAEVAMQPAARILAASVCILAAVHLGWRIEHDRTRDKRADASWVAFYGVGLLEADGADRLKVVFERFNEKHKAGREFDRFGCTRLLLSTEVSDALFKFLADRKKLANDAQPRP